MRLKWISAKIILSLKKREKEKETLVCCSHYKTLLYKLYYVSLNSAVMPFSAIYWMEVWATGTSCTKFCGGFIRKKMRYFLKKKSGI